MSKAITVKFQDAVVAKADQLAPQTPLKSRNAYINEAVNRLNKQFEREALARQFAVESQRVRAESMKVLAEFEALEDPIE